MASDRVVSVRVFACIKQQSDDFDLTMLRCQCERQVAVVTAGGRKELANFLQASQSRRDRQVHSSAARKQGVQRFQIAM
jgi:hypothetical protein